MRVFPVLLAALAFLALVVFLVSEPAVPRAGLVARGPWAGTDLRGGAELEADTEFEFELGAPRVALEREPDPAELEGAVWVEGRVELPAGTPDRGGVFVIAVGEPFEGGHYGAEAASDGTFRVAFAPTDRVVQLGLEAPHLVLAPPLRFRLADVPDGIVLRPELGARVIGRINLPEGARRAHTVPGEMIYMRAVGETSYAPVLALGPEGAGMVAGARIRRDLTYDFGVVPAGVTYMLDYEPSGFPEPGFGEFHPEPGTTEHADTWLERGVLVSGRVLGRGGQPVSQARVTLARPERFVYKGLEYQWTDRDGRFEGICPPGSLQVEVERAGYEPLERELGDVQDDVRDLVLELTGIGGGLRGIVLDPDGEGVRRADLRVYDGDGRNLLEDRRDDARTDRDGRFALEGLGEGPWVVAASARVKSARLGKKERHWKFEPDVQPGADLVLRLEPGEVIVGEVVDDRGLPLDSFELVATPRTYEHVSPFSSRGEAMRRRISGAKGRFRWGDLPPGRWWVYARDDYLALSDMAEVTLDGTAESMRLTIPRRATVTGTVRSGGEPVPNADVHTRNHNTWHTAPFDYRPYNSGAATDAQGRFRLRAGPGPFEIWATSLGRADGAHVSLDLPPGSSHEQVLELGTFGRLEVTLHPSLGEVAGETVSLSRIRHAWLDRSTTDESGRVVWEELTPAAYEVVLGPSLAMDGDRVEIRAGETVQHTLGGPGSIELTGVVRGAEGPVEGLSIRARAPSSEPGFAFGGSIGNQFVRDAIEAETAADGSFHMLVRSPGRYLFELGGRGKASYLRDVPAGGAQLEFELPGGSVSGRIVLAAGAPAPEGEVREVRNSKTGETIQLGPSYHFEARMRARSKPVPGFEDLRYARPDRDGHFRFDHVPDGRYVLFVCESRSEQLGRRSIDVRVEDGELSDLGAIELAAACTLQGEVLEAAGVPAAGAELRLITEERNWLNWFRDGTVDADGTFRIEGIGAGTYRLHVEQGEDELESGDITLRPGETRSIELRLE